MLVQVSLVYRNNSSGCVIDKVSRSIIVGTSPIVRCVSSRGNLNGVSDVAGEFFPYGLYSVRPLGTGPQQGRTERIGCVLECAHLRTNRQVGRVDFP